MVVAAIRTDAGRHSPCTCNISTAVGEGACEGRLFISHDATRGCLPGHHGVWRRCDQADALSRKLMDNVIEINDRLNTKVDKSNEDTNCKESKENNFMNKNFMNFKFGKVESDDVRVSMYGIAIKNVDGRYVSWDVKNHAVMDVEIMNMPCDDFLYMMPVAIKDIKSGDVVF